MANRYRQSARANSGDWKFEVRDWPANWPAQTISDGLRSPRPQRPRNAGLCAGHDEVSDFRECVAGAGGFEPPDGGIKIRQPLPPSPAESTMSAPRSKLLLVFCPPKSDIRRPDYDSRCRHGADMTAGWSHAGEDH